jgi:diguanylate cyclase
MAECIFCMGESIFAVRLTWDAGVMTAKSERHKRTLPFAKYAIDQIERFGLCADPKSFEVWYRYATGQNSELNQAINDAIASPDGLTEAKFDRLCGLYSSSERTGSRLGAAATGLSDEITQVMGMIGAAAVSSGAYGRQLDEGLISFEQTEPYEALKPVVEALVTATREMESETRALEVQLEESQTRAANLQEEVETLRVETLTDPLTLIGNRQYFDDSLTALTAAAMRTGKPLSLLFSDIDNFKDFNDRFGHQVGDQVLRLVAGLIKNTLREGDIVCRYGGEEFGIILPGSTLAVANMAAERIRAAITAREIKKAGDQGSYGRITMSIGVAQFLAGEAPLDFVERADACLYAAKRSGRNRVVNENHPEFLYFRTTRSR